MQTTIDSTGRIVVPKALRNALGLVGGETLEITACEGRIEIEVEPTAMRLERKGAGLVAVPEQALPPLTAEQVRATLETTRR